MYVKSAIFIVLFGIINTSYSIDWNEFKRMYNKHYSSVVEEAERKLIFIKNVNEIRAYEQTHPNTTFKIGINHLADQRIAEIFSHSQLHFKFHSKRMRKIENERYLPDSLDWREKGVITPVTTQGIMQQSTAIVAVEVTESLHAIQTKSLEIGSVARVVDCCSHQDDVFQCIAKLDGICREIDYPITTGQCLPNKCQPFAHFNKRMDLTTHNEDTMITWIQNSTLYVGINGVGSFVYYIAGIYNETKCSQTETNHMLQLVGYGKTDSRELFWIARNNWGTDWGEDGYIRILRGTNVCGIASTVIQIT